MSIRKHTSFKKGDKFGKRTILEFVGRDRWGHEIWLCQCECGSIKEVLRSNILSGKAQSCKACGTTKHGHKKNGKISVTYQTWLDIKKRCYDPNNKQYKDYGGRGIKLCERWQKFENFLEDMGERPSNLTIERLNNDGDYYFENCEWATRLEQNNNKRNNRHIEFNGETMNLSQYLRKVNLPYTTFYNRIYRGWSVERALGLTT
jgi:hypothetical protein